ncbi:uncharacterized protein [Arachis hypogaea]|uniref:uncharacterized protein isoform X4 n=1 Tax=Arachis hypogaea TaxID=3818 RepID=UPI003B215FD0
MGNSKKDEAKIEKIIRGLLKLPENRRCINCNLLGPQYVCTTFCTFVCTNCSGIHREFTHRVKSVSMAKFTLEEVEAIQAGGNERAKEIYFKCWDPQRHSYPESNNMQRLREFIKNVYVERKFTGEHHVDLPRIREEGKEEPYQKNSSTHGDLQHLPPFPISEATASPTSSDAWSIIPIQANEMEQPSNALPSNDEINHREESNKVLDWQTSPSMQFSPAVSVGSSSTAQPTSTPITPIAPNDMQSDVLNSHDPSSAFTELSPQTNSKPTQETKSGVGLKPSTVENRSTGRMELPEDLFSSSYLSGPPTPLSGWQNDQPQHHGMGYGLQYYPNAPSPSAFPIAARSSSNPFAATEDKPLAHTLSLPNMSCTLPVSPGAGLMHASSYGSSGMVPQSTSFGSPLVHPQSASGFPNSAYFGQVNNMQPPRFERAASTSDDESVFGSLSTMKLSSGEYMTQTTPNPFSKKGRNPFGDI